MSRRDNLFIYLLILFILFIYLDGIRLEHVSGFKYLGCVLDESSTDRAECSRKVASGRGVAGAIRYLVNNRDLQLVPVLMYGSENVMEGEG